jgi:predicted Rossmann fold nucleotide-binding protein DprA/Smf involved in DNA uptake
VSVIAVTGIRDLHPDSESAVAGAIALALAAPATELRFGGARGVDTVALAAALAAREARGHEARLHVFVPGRATEQPLEALDAIRRADLVTELGLPRGRAWTYLKRNEAMLAGADSVLAFTDGRADGGTAATIALAHARGIPVTLVRVSGTEPRPLELFRD